MHTHNHSHDHTHEHHHASRWLWFTIFFNILIVIAQCIGWMISWSLSLLSDAIHNASDVVSLLLSYIWEIFSKKKANQNYTFWYKKMEVLIAFINAISLIIIWIFIIIESFQRFFSPWESFNVIIMFWVGCIGLLWNLFWLIVLYKEKDHNLNKKSAYLHILYDTISSIIVVFWGIIIYYTWWIQLDLILSIIISLFIIISWWKLLFSSWHILIQWVPTSLNLEYIEKEILNLWWILNIHNMHVWNIDSNEIFFSAHVVIENSLIFETTQEKIKHILHDTLKITSSNIQIETKICT